MAYSGYFTPSGFTPRKATAAPFSAPGLPTFTAPERTGPVAERGMRAGAQAQESTLLGRASTISQKYQPQRTSTIAQTKAALKPYGGYVVKDDGSIEQAPQGTQPGDAYKSAYRQQMDAAGARGIIDSSFAAKSVGMAFGRLTAEAQGIVTQHAATMNSLVAQEANDFSEINSSLLQLYGDETQYLIDNPPPLPEDPPPAAPKAWTGTLTPKTKSNLAKAWGVPVGKVQITQLGGGKIKATVA